MTSRRSSTSGRQGKPEGLADQGLFDREWYQTMLFPPSLVELTLRAGWVSEANHLQVQVEVFDPSTKELLAMISVPHAHVEDAQDAARRLAEEASRLLLAVIDPEPF